MFIHTSAILFPKFALLKSRKEAVVIDNDATPSSIRFNIIIDVVIITTIIFKYAI